MALYRRRSIVHGIIYRHGMVAGSVYVVGCLTVDRVKLVAFRDRQVVLAVKHLT